MNIDINDIPVDAGIYAGLKDNKILVIGLGPSALAVAEVEREITIDEWSLMVEAAFSDPSDGAFNRAVDAAAAKFGLVQRFIPPLPVTGTPTLISDGPSTDT